ncbi:MAG: LamG domain-containing protein [Verrucomicrobiota bacterium]
MNSEDNDRLIDDLLEGAISEADFLRLEAELIVSPEAREAYYDRLKLHTGLQEEARSAGNETSSAAPLPKAPRRKLDPILFAALGALALLVLVLSWKVASDTPDPIVEPRAFGFGVLADLVDSKWGPGVTLFRGDLVPAESLTLAEGMARIELFNGVVLVLEGPATFSLDSEKDLTLSSGTIHARIPAIASDFQILTPQGKLTRCGLELSATVTNESTTIQVLEDSADWLTPSGKTETILEGNALQIDTEGSLTSTQPDGVSIADLEAGFDRGRVSRLNAWKTYRAELLEDPGLLAYYATTSPAPNGSGFDDLSSASSVGAVVLASTTTDRWGRAQSALDFSPTGSRVRVTLPGEHASLSLMSWVRIDSLDRLYNSLFLTDGHEIYEPHWQIMSDGRIFFSVRARDSGKGGGDKHITFSPPIWRPSQSGQWIHIATVFDGQKQNVTHYLNGEPITMESIPDALQPEKVVIGSASIGNWSEPAYRKDPEFAVRNLNGSLDDVVLWNRPLLASEVREIYTQSKP